MSNIIYLKANAALDTVDTNSNTNVFGYDVMYEINQDIRAFEFIIQSNDDGDKGYLHSIISQGNCASSLFLRSLNTTTGKLIGFENPFSATNGCVPATNSNNPGILIQLLFTKKFTKKPSITGIHISDPNKSPISTTHGGSIITLPDSITSNTPNDASGHYEFELYSDIWDLSGTTQYSDDVLQNPATSIVDWNTVGTYNILWTNTDAQAPSVTTTKSITIAVLDTTPVTVSAVSISSDNDGYPNWAKSGSIVTLTFTASEKIKTPVVTFDIIYDNSNIDTFSGDVITYTNTTVSSGNNDDVWTASFQPDATDSGSIVCSLTCTDYQNDNNNIVISTTDTTAMIYDNIQPSVQTFTIDSTNFNKDTSATVTLTFSETVIDFSNDDITISSDNDNPVGSLTSMSSDDGGITWSGTFTPATGIEVNDATLTLSNSWSDRAGNNGVTATSTVVFDVDTKTPSVQNFTLNKTTLSINDNATVTLEFSESVNNFNSDADITISSYNNSPVGSLTEMTSDDGGITWTGTFSPATGIEVNDLTLTLSNNWKDLAGNTGVTAVSGLFNVDTSRPIVENIILSNSNAEELNSTPLSYGLGDSIYLRVKFSHVVQVSDGYEPELVLWSVNKKAVYESITPSSVYLLFKYNVEDDIDESNLVVTDINNHTSILDGAGNHIVPFETSNPVTVASINIDGVAPTINSMTTSWVNIMVHRTIPR